MPKSMKASWFCNVYCYTGLISAFVYFPIKSTSINKLFETKYTETEYDRHLQPLVEFSLPDTWRHSTLAIWL